MVLGGGWWEGFNPVHVFECIFRASGNLTWTIPLPVVLFLVGLFSTHPVDHDYLGSLSCLERGIETNPLKFIISPISCSLHHIP